MAVINSSTTQNMLIDRLRRHRYFREIADAHLEQLAIQATCYSFDPGEIIFMDGAASAGLWVIGEGQVKIFKISTEGNEHILHLVGPGDSFNDIAGLDGGPNPASAAALNRVTCCVLTHETLMTAIAADPVLATTLVKFMTGRTRELVQQLENLALYSVTTRLARFLLKQAGNPALNGPNITRAAIAAHLATQPETISRALGSLEKSGIITVKRTHITILQEDMLRMVALL